ncbi:hypothetical protein Tco_1360650 [Tanacetum coccineum]
MKNAQSSPFYFSDDDHSVDKVTIPSKVYNMEETRPSVTEKPTNGSLCLEVNFEFDTVMNEECLKYVTLDKKLIQSSPFYFSDDDHFVDKITIPSKVCSLDNMEEAGPSVTENPTNGSLCLEVDFENDDDDMMIDAPSVRDLYQLAKAGLSLTENPTNGSLHLEVALENFDHDTMIDAPSVRDLDQLTEVSRMRQVQS